MQELCERMTAQEFGEWKLMFNAEGWHPSVPNLHHALALAAHANGPLRREGGRLWDGQDFAAPDPWAPPPPAAPGISHDTIAAQVALINARFEAP